MKFFLIVNTRKNNAFSVAINCVKELLELGAIVVVENTYKGNFLNLNITYMQKKEALNYCDYILTVGGDGTILQAARENLNYNLPILGVNVGNLGFLTTIEPDEINKLKDIVDNKFYLDERSILDIAIDGEPQNKLAINDFVIGKTSVLHTIGVKIYCDDVLVNDYIGDGVIISTPTGSTAYSLSAGGPILDAKVDGIVVTPLCAHSMRSPPMVFSKSRKLRVVINNNGRSESCCSCDGRQEIILKDECTIDIKISKQKMLLMCLSKTDQFKAIDKKLRGR